MKAMTTLELLHAVVAHAAHAALSAAQANGTNVLLILWISAGWRISGQEFRTKRQRPQMLHWLKRS